MPPGIIGRSAVFVSLTAAVLTIIFYLIDLAAHNQQKRWKLAARASYFLAAAGILTAFGSLGWIVYHRLYMYDYAVQHTGNDLHNHWFRFAATWSGQEGSFLLWAFWTSIIGFVVLFRAGKDESRVMPIYTTVIAFLSMILIKQTPFNLFLKVNPGLPGIPANGLGLTPSLQNYWMTIHPPTIFFGFASLAVPYSYAIAALLWKDYNRWAKMVFPYALLSSAVLGLGLFMGGYWAYETLGWHGFWAWDPVENASFFPWLAVTALTHGLVSQRTKGGMTRTNLFFGMLAFWLFLVGTFLTRSGALASKMPNGQLLSVHAFDNISKSGLWLMKGMLVVYGLSALSLWLFRIRKIPTRPSLGDSMLSRDFALFLAVLLMGVACAIVTLGSTTPLFLSWLHRPPSAPDPTFYNRAMLPLMFPVTLALGCVPWLAWRRTDPDKFLKKLLIPWFVMLGFGFFMLIWTLNAQRYMAAVTDPQVLKDTLHVWMGASVQRILVVSLTSLGFFAALSNSILAFRIFRKKPLTSGAWIAHVGIGVLVIGIIASNTFERTALVTLKQGEGPISAFGYQIAYEGMTGVGVKGRPLDPEYDQNNRVMLRITPPGSDNSGSADAPHSFLLQPRWFIPRPSPREEAEGNPDTMIWPAIKKYPLHDLYIGLASQPSLEMPYVNVTPRTSAQAGPYKFFYLKAIKKPLQYMGAVIGIVDTVQPFDTPDHTGIVPAQPGISFLQNEDGSIMRSDQGMPLMVKTDESLPQVPNSQGQPSAVILDRLNASNDAARIAFSLPAVQATWTIPLSITYKPWVNLVWLGVLMAVAGTLMAMVRRALEANRVEEIVEEPEELEDVEKAPAPGGKRRRPLGLAGAAPISIAKRRQ